MKLSKRLFLCFCIIVFSPVSFAIRCGHELVDLGDHKQDVLRKCGEPESIDTHIEIRGVSDFADETQYLPDGMRRFPNASVSIGQQRYMEVEVVVEEWVYDFGRRRFKQYLRFENGRLRQINNLGRH